MIKIIVSSVGFRIIGLGNLNRTWRHYGSIQLMAIEVDWPNGWNRNCDLHRISGQQCANRIAPGLPQWRGFVVCAIVLGGEDDQSYRPTNILQVHNTHSAHVSKVLTLSSTHLMPYVDAQFRYMKVDSYVQIDNILAYTGLWYKARSTDRTRYSSIWPNFGENRWKDHPQHKMPPLSNWNAIKF